MSEPDKDAFSDDIEAQILSLDPRHWAAARERVAALRQYLSVARPTSAAARDAAASAGISSARFYEILRRWRDTGSVATIVPHASGSDRRSDRLPQEIVNLIEATAERVMASDPDANLDTVWHAVRHACEAAGLPSPSRVTVRRRVAKVLKGLGGRPSPDDQKQEAPSSQVILLDRATVTLACRDELGTIGLPTVGLALLGSTGEILSNRIFFDQTFPQTVAAVLHDLLREGLVWTKYTPDGLSLILDRGNGEEWTELLGVMTSLQLDAQASRSPRPGNGRHLRKYLPTRLGAIPITTQGVVDGAQERLRRYRGQARRNLVEITVSDVERAVGHGAASYNASLSKTYSTARSEPTIHPKVTEALIALRNIWTRATRSL